MGGTLPGGADGGNNGYSVMEMKVCDEEGRAQVCPPALPPPCQCLWTGKHQLALEQGCAFLRCASGN